MKTSWGFKFHLNNGGGSLSHSLVLSKLLMGKRPGLTEHSRGLEARLLSHLGCEIPLTSNFGWRMSHGPGQSFLRAWLQAEALPTTSPFSAHFFYRGRLVPLSADSHHSLHPPYISCALILSGSLLVSAPDLTQHGFHDENKTTGDSQCDPELCPLSLPCLHGECPLTGGRLSRPGPPKAGQHSLSGNPSSPERYDYVIRG